MQKVRYEWLDAGDCLAVPVRGVPLASSTPRPCGRQLSAGPLLTSVPDGLPAVNSDRASLQTPGRRPLPSQDEASTLACGARTGRARRTPDSVPAEDHSAGIERGLTARPSPFRICRVSGMYLSARAALVLSYEEVAHFGGDDGVSERPLPLARPHCARPAAVLASARGALVSSLLASLLPLASSRGLSRFARSASPRERSAPFEFPPDAS